MGSFKRMGIAIAIIVQIAAGSAGSQDLPPPPVPGFTDETDPTCGLDCDIPRDPLTGGDKPYSGFDDNLMPMGMRRLPAVSESAMMESQALEYVGNSYSRIYAEYNGTLYPLQGVVEIEGQTVRTDRLATMMEDSGARGAVALSDRRRSDARFIEANGKSLARADYLLPAPSEPYDVFLTQLDPDETRLGNAWALDFLGTSALPTQDILTRFGAQASAHIIHDTGYTGGDRFDVRTISLGDPPGAGQTIVTGSNWKSVPLALQLDNQVMDIDILGLSDQQLQFFLEANNHEASEDFQFNHAYARVWNKEATTVAAGRTWSLFGEGGATPATLDQTTVLIGTTHRLDLPQIRLQQSAPSDGGIGWGLAIENALKDDYQIPAGGTKLSRWPTFAGNLVYRGADAANRVQLSGLVRSVGFQTATGEEHLSTGWGLAAYATRIVFSQPYTTGGLFLGLAGGEGVGRYINGISDSAAFHDGSMSVLEVTGTFAGYKQRWLTASGWEIESNLAYGYTHLDDPAFMLQEATYRETNVTLHHGWVNLFVMPNDRIATGFQYQYGRRETVAGGPGEDNRFMFVLMLGLTPKTQATNLYSDYSGQQYYIPNSELGIYEGSAGTAHRQSL